jgi:hypothetical protein
MPLRGDEVADRIEAKIREAVNRMMEEVRTSIADVREAMEQQLDAALKSVQADVNAFAFRDEVDRGLRELEGSYQEQIRELEERKPAPPAAAATTPSAVKESIRAVEAGRNQVDILSAMLDECLKFGSRSALMILKGESFAGWKAAGFSAHGGNDEALKRFTAGRDSVPQFDELLREERTVIWDGQNLSGRFGVTAASRAALVPMVIKDKVAAAVYVDATPEDASRFDQSAIELLVFATGLLVDTLAIRKKIPTPTLSDAAHTLGPVSPAAPEPEHVDASATLAVRAADFSIRAESTAPGAPAPAAPEAQQPPDGGTETQQPAAAAETTAPAPRRNFELQTESPAERSWPAITAPEEPEVESSFATAILPSAKPSGEDTGGAASKPGDPGDRPSTQYIPPPGLTRGGAWIAKTDDERKHEEAKRFARLLVSEIKLYNESQVEQGRRDKDLYERLKEDIDRSRQMYDERVPDEVRRGTNYFYDELVRILADGNRDALGL